MSPHCTQGAADTYPAYPPHLSVTVLLHPVSRHPCVAARLEVRVQSSRAPESGSNLCSLCTVGALGLAQPSGPSLCILSHVCPGGKAAHPKVGSSTAGTCPHLPVLGRLQFGIPGLTLTGCPPTPGSQSQPCQCSLRQRDSHSEASTPTRRKQDCRGARAERIKEYHPVCFLNSLLHFKQGAYFPIY